MVLLVVLGLFVHPAGAHKHDGKAHGNIHKRAAAKCAAGKYSSTGSEPCAPCPAGSYSKGERLQPCQYYQNDTNYETIWIETGRTSCILARAGYYIPTAGATSEKDCGASKYAPTAGMTACLPCPPGYMCPSNNVHTPQQCSPGRYSTGGVAYCPLCAAGTFNTIHSATGCCPCPAGCFTVSGMRSMKKSKLIEFVGSNGSYELPKVSSSFLCGTIFLTATRCQWDRPYCNPGSTSSGQCVKKQGDYFLTGDCTLGGSGSACRAYHISPYLNVRYAK